MFKKDILKLKRAVRSFQHELKADPYRKPYSGTQYHCPVCDTDLAYFNPIDNEYIALLDKYEYDYSLFRDETFYLLKYYCPACQASDRERMYALYFLDWMKKADKTKTYNFVDFAPAVTLSAFFRRFSFLNYRTADLYMEGVDDKVDLTDMKIYKDNSMDIFVCSHVLEHVDEDRKAMSELYRILKPGGWGITMVPILTNSDHVIENLPISSEADRWKYYGQGDHVRYYNQQGFVERLKGAGFKVTLLGANHFGAEQFEKHGIHPRSVLYIVEKL